MRILIATTYRGPWGGAEKYLQSVIPSLVQRGHSVALLYESPIDPAAHVIDEEAGEIPAWCSQELGVPATMQSIAAWKPDVVYSHGLDDFHLEGALLDAHPVVLFAHTYYGTCISGRKCFSSPRLEPCTRRFGAGCLAVYYPRRCGGVNPRTMLQLFQLQSKRRSNLPRYQTVLVASRHMRHEMSENGVPVDRLRQIALPTPSTDSAGMVDRPTPGSRLLFVGRLMDVKGASELLRAIPLAAEKLGRSLTVTIAGDGPQRSEVESLARRLRLSVNFAGWVNSEQRSQLMQEADLLAVPSLWPEPFGLVGIEAGCFGLPAVGFAVGGIPDWLIPGVSGELAPGDPPSVEGLAEAIWRALRDPDHYQRLRKGAWETAGTFSLERHLSQLEEILGATTAARHLVPTSA